MTVVLVEFVKCIGARIFIISVTEHHGHLLQASSNLQVAASH